MEKKEQSKNSEDFEPHRKIKKRDGKFRDSKFRPEKRFNKFKRTFKKSEKHEKKPHENMVNIMVTNLPDTLTLTEIKELFSEFGELLKISIFWEPRIKNSMNVRIAYNNRESCQSAVEKMNQAELDDKVMKIWILDPKHDV